LGFVSRERDHNRGGAFLLPLLRFGEPAWWRGQNKAWVVGGEFLVEVLKIKRCGDPMYNHLYNGGVEVKGAGSRDGR
jgi:hypothetical protein